MHQPQLFLTIPFFPTISLEFITEFDDISSLRSFLSSKYNIPSETLTFYNNTHLLSNENLLGSLQGFIHASIGLSGGKGGFGSLLRGQAATKRKTTNFDASKDLKGRRIRNVENEKKLKEFLKNKQKEDQDVEEEIKKYKEMSEKQSQMHYEMKLTQEYKNKLEDWEHKMGKSIAVGVNKLKREGNHVDQKNGGFEVPKKKICLEINKKIKNMYEEEDKEEEEKRIEMEERERKQKLEEELKKDEKLEKPLAIEYPEIDLKGIKSIEDLENLGSEHLKHGLMKLGLKCGGNLRERAQRLFDIKLDPTNLLNPKYLAKAKK